jgi:sialate O-acetylesterase
MKKCLSCYAAVLSLLLVAYSVPQAQADVSLPKVFSSHMVLQRDMALPIWGWADPGEEVTVWLDRATATAKADAKGGWEVTLPAVKADGKAHRMTISGKNKIELDDILIGEVWIGSGQSNMEFNLAGSTGGKEAVAAANCPQIRLLHVEKVQTPQPAKDIVVFNGPKVKNRPAPPPATGPAWKACMPQNVPNFSAVLYYFGQRLHKELNVPVGLINSSWGGSPIEAWIASGKKNGSMYNGMIAPVKPFAIRGAIWYQGEANVNQKNGPTYAEKMKALIEGWRHMWGQDFSFYFAQIAPWSGRYEPGRLPILWDCQVESLKIPGTGMAVTTDLVDNFKDIHPKNKLDVGNRLALWALAKDYGKRDLVYSGPLYKSMKVEGAKIRLSFAQVGGGLKSRDGKPLAEFEIAGADGRFIPAEAVVDGNTILVHTKEVASPTQVRFGWRNEANPNLVNNEGLPASPFQTNNWQGGTGE